MAKTGFGTTATVGGVALSEVQSIGIPGLSGEVVDVTHLSSTNRWREFIRGLRDAGEFSISMLYEAGSASDDACIAAITADAATAVVVDANAASGTEDFTISAFGTTYEVDDLEPGSPQTATLTLKPTGSVSQAPT